MSQDIGDTEQPPTMSKARLLITAATVENRTVAEVAATYGVSRSWLCELLARYRQEGDAALGPRSRHGTAQRLVDTARSRT